MLGAAGALVLGLAGCGDGGTTAQQQSSTSGDITVSAAASLTEAFMAVGKRFEEANPDVTVQFNFAGSSTLSRQIIQGAPADVFASANPMQMQAVTDGGDAAGQPTVFVANTLQVVVPAGNPAGVTSLADFGKQDLNIALCAEQVPCGALSQTVFETAGVTPSPDTLERDVKAVLTKVALGEADAGLVYRTDVTTADERDVEGIDLPEAAEAVNEYPIVTLANGPNAEAGQAFVDYVLSDEGQAVLEDYGFGTDVE